MLKTSFVALALTLTLAATTAAFAAPKQDRWTDTYNQTFYDPPQDSVLFDRAKGHIDY